MAYEKQTWNTGDVITADKLNHMEDGIAAGGMLVVTDTNGTLNKTWQEIYDAMMNGQICLISESMISETECNFQLVVGIEVIDNYRVYTQNGQYNASSADGYPAMVGT